MIPAEKRAANLLEGKRLDGGWLVKEKLNPNGSSAYSSCYLVEKGEKKGFLKAFDYSSAGKIGNDDLKEIPEIIKAFEFERDILEKCVKYHCKNVVEILDNGVLDVENAEKYPRVHYLILEFSEEGDVNKALESEKSIKWKAKSLHQIAKGLNQLHKISIAHQDVKPENVVTFNEYSKITDLGSAVDLNSHSDDIPKKYLDRDYCGTWELAPPELLYGQVSTDKIVRRIGCDLYLLGNLVVYYFTGYNINFLITANLSDEFSWKNPSNRGRYESIRSYLTLAFFESLNDIRKEISDEKLGEKVVDVVKFLCHPDPLVRGHEKNIRPFNKEQNYGLDRFVSTFDWMQKYVSQKNI